MEKSLDSEMAVRAPEGVLFMSPDEVAVMMGDFGVQRAVSLMHPDRFPSVECGKTAVGAVINTYAQQHPLQTDG